MNTISSIFTAALDTAEEFPVAFAIVGILVGLVAIVVAVLA